MPQFEDVAETVKIEQEKRAQMRREGDRNYTPAFEEDVSVPGVLGSWVSVEVEPDGYFITVETDPYEGSAQMALPVAERLLEVLTKAIAVANDLPGGKRAQAEAACGHEAESFSPYRHG
jgi:hypothetical protein